MSRNRRLPGTETLVWLTWRSNAQQRPQVGEEIRVWWPGRGDPLARTLTSSAPITPRTAEDAAKLERVQLSAAHYVAEVVHARELTAEKNKSFELGVSFLRYDQSGALPRQEIAMDAGITRTIARKEDNQAYQYQTSRAADWLSRHFLLAPAPGAEPGTPGRVIVSAMPGGNGDSTGYRLHGRGYVADVRTIDNQLHLRRLRNPTNEDRARPLRLVHADITFKDVTAAGQIRADMQHWIDKLASGKGFLAMWQEYNRLEARQLHRLVKQAGKCRYQDWELLPDGSYSFSVTAQSAAEGDEPSLLKQAQLALDGHGELQLEAAQLLPPVFGPAGDDGPDDWNLIEAKAGPHVFTGTVVAVDPAGTILLRRANFGNRGPLRVGGDRAEQLLPTGWLYRSYRGDRQQLARRKKAFDRILAGGTNIPNLLALLEGEQVAVGPRGKITARSDAAWALFGKKGPTDRQEKAIDVALNTPDMAIIQGPPGTGKTEVVAAIQIRLAEEGKSYARIRGSILLASFQHAAVEEMASRSVIFGIPADKIDRADRGTAELRDKLKDVAVAGVTAADGAPVAPVLALRELSSLVAGYWLAPPSASGTMSLLGQVLELARSHISVALLDRLAGARDKLAIALASAPTQTARADADDLALLAVRGLRTTAEAFSDDGPQAAAKALRRLGALAHGGGLADTDADLLRQAAACATDQPPDLSALTVLRDRLLDLLQPAGGPIPVAVADPAIADLLGEAVTEMDENLRRSADIGPALAIADYLEALRGDPEAVEWTLRAYTASYATTCQQADSPKIAAAKAVRRDDDILFDTVIIDEAARANPLDLMIPMALAARRIVLVGDHRQLPPLLEPEVERELAQHDQANAGDLRQSLFQRLFEAHGKAGAPVERVVRLDAQFRMHKVLGEFVSQNFYDGKLDSPIGTEGFAHGLERYGSAVACWVDVPADRGPEHRSRTMSTYRPAEADWIAGEVDGLIRGHPQLKFGVIAFYADQAEEIGTLLTERGIAERMARGRYAASKDFSHDSRGEPLERLLVGTVDSFQGKQFDVVLLSVTRSAPLRDEQPPRDPGPYTRWVRRRYGHVLLRNRLCVAMSRQRRLLIAVGDAAMFSPGRAPAEAAPFANFLRLCQAGGDHGRFLSA